MPGLLRGVARTAAIVGTASAVGGRVQHRQQQRWAQEAPPQAQPQQVVYAAPAPPPAAPAPAAASGTDDKLEQLTKLGELKAQGILTEAEFAAEKAKILA